MDALLDSLNGFLFTGGTGLTLFTIDISHWYAMLVPMSGADLDPPAAALRVLDRSRELFKEPRPRSGSKMHQSWWLPEIRKLTSWGWYFIPIFTGLFIHPKWWLFGISAINSINLCWFTLPVFQAGDPENQLPVWGTCLGFEWLASSPRGNIPQQLTIIFDSFLVTVIRGCSHITTKFDLWFQVGSFFLLVEMVEFISDQFLRVVRVVRGRDSCDSCAILILISAGGQKMWIFHCTSRTSHSCKRKWLEFSG